MSVLVALGTTAAYCYSLVSMVLAALQPQYEGHVYFETSCMILTFVCGGKYLEAKAKARTSDVVGSLLSLAAKTAILVSPGDTAGDNSHQQQEREVPLEQVQKGDLLKVLPGATVPTDGVVVTGTSAVDEALVTGEPLPVTKVPGGQLIGGTINTTGVLLMRATQVGGGKEFVRVGESSMMKAPVHV